ncbi:MAG: histidine phosphatase family protein, partial [Clostridia bacterium]|nr:histidine phosphatase family protein [Clostridia bacterium]
SLPLAKEKGLSVIKTPRLREIYAGLWEGLPVSELREKFPESCHTWWYDTGLARPDGGESVEELQERVLSFVKEVAEENAGKTICLFTHFTPIYALKTAWSGVPLSEMKNMPKPQNASVTHVVYENGKFEILEYAYNGYLGDLKSDFAG